MEIQESTRELQHWKSKAEKSRAFYEAHGCTYEQEHPIIHFRNTFLINKR
jgi:hypothetical protein